MKKNKRIARFIAGVMGMCVILSSLSTGYAMPNVYAAEMQQEAETESAFSAEELSLEEEDFSFVIDEMIEDYIGMTDEENTEFGVEVHELDSRPATYEITYTNVGSNQDYHGPHSFGPMGTISNPKGVLIDKLRCYVYLMENDELVVLHEEDCNITGKTFVQEYNSMTDFVGEWKNSHAARGRLKGGTSYYYKLSAHAGDGWHDSPFGYYDSYGVNIDNFYLNETNKSVPLGTEFYISSTFTPDDAYPPSLKWKSSNENVATVADDGKITTKRAGETVITAYNSYPRLISTCKVTVISVPQTCDGNPNVGWEYVYGKAYWYEKKGGQFVKQGTYGSPGNVWYDGIERGREIYDPCSDAWYWLDALYDGAKAVNKEVFMPYVYSEESTYDNETIQYLSKQSDKYTESGIIGEMSRKVENAIRNKLGKWVRYDGNGRMIKGWYTVKGNDCQHYPNQIGNTYFYDYKTGLMAKGLTRIGGVDYFFDPVTGALQ